MSEVASRPAPTRGRGSTRGRGGFRGSTRSQRQINGDSKDGSVFEEADQGELGQMKKKYSSQLSSLKEVFPDWADVDLLFALEETDGDLDRTIDHISEGNVSQFSDVKKKVKDRSRSKVKEPIPEHGSRAPRGRGAYDSSRGGRGRPDRGRGAPRTGRGGIQQNLKSPNSIPTNESSAWDNTAQNETSEWNSASANSKTGSTKPVAEATKAAPVQTGPPKKTWASMFAQPKPAPPPPKPAAAEPSINQDASNIPETVPQPADEIPSVEATPAIEPPIIEIDDANVQIPPSKDKLTEDNVEHLPDVSQPAPTGTAASTVESSRGPDSATPSVIAQGSQQPPIGRPGLGGYATTALKATTPQGRSASFQRRLLEQQEAVVMPGNHAVDRAAVQFGSLGLNGDINDLDVDEDREEAETRPQPPQHSPVAQPKTALPPAPRQEAPAQEPAAVKPAPGLPPVPQQSIAQQSGPSPLAAQTVGQQSGQGYNQFGRYGQSNEPASQKSYDPFGQQPSQQSPFDAYSAQSQAPNQQQHAATSQLSGFSSAANDYSNYYTSDQQRNYQNYYGYGQQHSAGQQEAGASQQRTGSAFGASNETAFPANQSQQQQQGRFNENQQSGHNTPNPPASGAQHHASAGQSQQPVHQQSHGQQGGYPYNSHPYYNQPYYSAYMNQYQGYNQQGYAPFGKAGMYGHPHHGYGVPQTSYDQHSSSPAMAGSFGREGGLGSGLGSDFTRSGSAQPSGTQSSTSGFGNDVFGRSPGSFPGQTQQFGQQSAGQQSGNEESLKPYSEKSSAQAGTAISGPGRPTSATNSNQAGQSGLPPPQSHQGFGGSYPSQFSQMQQGAQGSQYGGLGGLSGHQGGAQQQQQQQQSHQGAGGYGGYSGFGNNYQSYGNRGGWGGNYGH